MTSETLPTPAPPPPPLVAATGQPDHYRPDAPLPLVATARQFAEANTRWTWAVTYAKFAPHWYVLRREADQAGYDALRKLIQRHHEIRTWRGRSFRAVTLAGLTLWIMPDDPGTTNGGTILINAKPAERADWSSPPPAPAPAPTLFD